MVSRETLTKRIAWVSAIANILLTIGKLMAGWLGKSDAVFADGIHSGADVFASVIVLLVIRVSNKPADKEHPYGHGKAEVLVSEIIGLILLLVSFYLVYESLSGFFEPVAAPSMIALWTALFSYVTKEILYRTSYKIAQTQRSKAIEAIAFDHKADIVASIAATVGVLFSIIGEYSHVSVFLYGDKLATLVVAYLIFKIAREMVKEAFDILLERNIEPFILSDYKSIISSFADVRRIDKVRAREHGHYVLVDIRISIDNQKTVKQGHDLSREIKRALMNKYDNIEEVLIHLNPYFSEK